MSRRMTGNEFQKKERFLVIEYPLYTEDDKAEKLFLHCDNTRVMEYKGPDHKMSHVEHWIGGDPNKVVRLWDTSLIAELRDSKAFSYYDLNETRDPAVKEAYEEMQNKMFELMMKNADIDDEWAQIAEAS